MQKPKILAIIIARGGSKSIPRKNVLPLHGKPLVAWPIILAKSVPAINRVIVSTDDEEITDIARQYGAEVPFRRPAELADDTTETLPVLQHALKFLAEKEDYRPDIVALLYPTAPFLRKERVIEALKLFEKTNCNSVVSVTPDFGKFWIDEGGVNRRLYPLVPVRRQLAKPLFREDGAIYFNRYEVLMKKNLIVDEANTQFVIMDEGENIDIDNPSDLQAAKKKEMENE